LGSDVDPHQAEVCRRFGVEPMPLDADMNVGISRNVREGVVPVNALRHPRERNTSGWYIWAGETLSDADDFFVPLHASHVGDWCAEIVPYLALPPGFRVLLVPGYEDVWTDPSLVA